MAVFSSTARTHFRIISCTFTAGVVGGVANMLTAFLFGALHITTALGVDIAPPLEDKAALYSKAFWGGLWGLVFLLPWRRLSQNWWVRALVPGEYLQVFCYILHSPPKSLLVAGLLPSLVQMFVVFPLATPYHIGGVGLGTLTPLFVIIFNTLGWSMPAYAWFCACGDTLQ